MGEFEQRIEILAMFANHLALLQRQDGAAPWTAVQAVLLNLVGFYSQFVDNIRSTMAQELTVHERELQVSCTRVERLNGVHLLIIRATSKVTNTAQLLVHVGVHRSAKVATTGLRGESADCRTAQETTAQAYSASCGSVWSTGNPASEWVKGILRLQRPSEYQW